MCIVLKPFMVQLPLNTFKKEQVEKIFNEIKKEFNDAKLKWYKADLPFFLGTATLEDIKNKVESTKEEGNCGIIKVKGKEAVVVAGKTLAVIGFFLAENFSAGDGAKINAAIGRVIGKGLLGA